MKNKKASKPAVKPKAKKTVVKITKKNQLSKKGGGFKQSYYDRHSAW